MSEGPIRTDATIWLGTSGIGVWIPTAGTSMPECPRPIPSTLKGVIIRHTGEADTIFAHRTFTAPRVGRLKAPSIAATPSGLGAFAS